MLTTVLALPKQSTTRVCNIHRDNDPMWLPSQVRNSNSPNHAPLPSHRNRDKLKDWLLTFYKYSTFNTCPHKVLA